MSDDKNWPKMLYRKGEKGELESRVFASAEEVEPGWGSRRAALGMPESAQPIIVKEGDLIALKADLAKATLAIGERDTTIAAQATEIEALKADLAKAMETKTAKPAKS